MRHQRDYLKTGLSNNGIDEKGKGDAFFSGL